MDEGSGAARERAAFLRALGRGGNVTQAAKKAGVHRTTVYGWRDRDPAFAQAMEEARTKAVAALAADGGAVCAMDQAVWQGARQKPRVTQIKAEGSRWTAVAEQRFLDALAEDCNVRGAAAAAGFSTTAIYRRRRLHAAFRAGWEAAIEEGWARLRTKLLRQASNGIARDAEDGPARIAEPDEDRAIPDTALALNLLKQHQATAAAAARARGGAAEEAGAEASIEGVRDKVIAGVRGLRREREAEVKAEGEANDLPVAPAQAGAHLSDLQDGSG